jgi:hypothetical protein
LCTNADAGAHSNNTTLGEKLLTCVGRNSRRRARLCDRISCILQDTYNHSESSHDVRTRKSSIMRSRLCTCPCMQCYQNSPLRLATDDFPPGQSILLVSILSLVYCDTGFYVTLTFGICLAASGLGDVLNACSTSRVVMHTSGERNSLCFLESCNEKIFENCSSCCSFLADMLSFFFFFSDDSYHIRPLACVEGATQHNASSEL